MGYLERKQAKIERYHQYADNAEDRSEAAHKGVRAIADHIPFGQPILVGHHSERHARRDAERIHNGMGKAIAEADRAAYWRRRAEALENDTSISRYDPDAVPLLEAKVALLEEQRDSMKRVNKAVKAKCKPASLVGLSEAEVSYAERLLAAGPDFMGRVGLAPYVFTNLSANIRRYKARLDQARQDASQRWSAEERRELAIDAFYKGRHPAFKDAVMQRVSAWLRDGTYEKGKWQEFKRLVVNVLSDDEIDALLGQEQAAE